MPKLGSLLTAAFPSRTPEGQRVVLAIGACGGDVPSAYEFATELGFDNRHQLARTLMRAGLPPLEHLAGWAMVLNWVLRYEQEGATLCEIALETSRDPAVFYRLIKRLTGRVWTEVTALGVLWVITTVRQRYGYGPIPPGQNPLRRRSGDNERPLAKTQ
jgi:hypothetical protein